MENKELVEYKENFITKIKNFFKCLFKRNEIIENDTVVTKEIEETKEEKTLEKNDFQEGIKVTISGPSNEQKKREFLKEIDGNKKALYDLSLDRLQKLEKYYDEVIKKNAEEIEKLKKSA